MENETVQITFKSHEDAIKALQATDAFSALEDTYQDLFKGARKQRYEKYEGGEIEAALEEANKQHVNAGFDSEGKPLQIGAGTKLVKLLEEEFENILHEHGIVLHV